MSTNNIEVSHVFENGTGNTVVQQSARTNLLKSNF